jgi:hypothetical protein
LNEYAVHVFAGVKSGNQLQELFLFNLPGQYMLEGAYTNLLAGPGLVPYIDPGGMVFAHEHNGEARREGLFIFQPLAFGLQFTADPQGYFLSTNSLGHNICHNLHSILEH